MARLDMDVHLPDQHKTEDCGTEGTMRLMAMTAWVRLSTPSFGLGIVLLSNWTHIWLS
jgi:hypothetical protein